MIKDNKAVEDGQNLDAHGGWSAVLSDLVAEVDLTPAASRAAQGSILRGEASDAQVAGFIIALGMKGGSVLELTGLVEAMMDAAAPLDLPAGGIDIVGRGGAPSRRRHALSVSTMAAGVASAAGAMISTHSYALVLISRTGHTCEGPLHISLTCVLVNLRGRKN